MNWIFEHAGIIAGIISFAAYLIYVISIFRGETKPSRSTWWILTLVGVLIFATSFAIGATESMWIQIVYIVGPLFIAILSLSSKYGYKTKLLLVDKISLVGAIVCGAIWIFFNSPFIAFLGGIVVDFIGLIPTIQKSYVDPEKENPFAWSIETIASLINALGIGAWFTLEDKNWIYALYFLLINGTISLLLLRPRIKKLFQFR
jgi:hypothetical protein